MQDYGFRLYNPSIGKFLSVDPLASNYSMLTPYQFAANKPIRMIDLDGLESLDPQTGETSPNPDVQSNGNNATDAAIYGYSMAPVDVTRPNKYGPTDYEISQSKKQGGDYEYRTGSFGGSGAVTLWDGYQRGKYKNKIVADSKTAVSKINLAEKANDLDAAKNAAREASNNRTVNRLGAQEKLSPGGRAISQTLDKNNTKTFNDFVGRYPGDNEFDTYRNVATKSGASNAADALLHKGAKRLGTIGTIYEATTITTTILNAPTDKRVEVAAREGSGFAGGAVGGALGTAGAVAVLGLLSSNPAGWVVIAVGAAGGIGGSYLGDKGGRAAADTIINSDNN